MIDSPPLILFSLQSLTFTYLASANFASLFPALVVRQLMLNPINNFIIACGGSIWHGPPPHLPLQFQWQHFAIVHIQLSLVRYHPPSGDLPACASSSIRMQMNDYTDRNRGRVSSRSG